MTKKINNKKELDEEPRKRILPNIIVAIFIIILTGFLAWYKFGPEFFTEIGSEFKNSYEEKGILPFIAMFVIFATAIFFIVRYKIKQLKSEKENKTPYSIISYIIVPVMFYFCIPMMFVIIVFLGSLQAQFGYNTTFLNESRENIELAASSATTAAMDLIIKIYNLGRNKPVFYMWLCVGAMIFLLLQALRRGKEQYAEDVDPQQLLDELDYKDLSKKDLEEIDMLVKGKMRKKYIDEIEKEKKRAGKRKDYSTELIINTNKLKGGKT